MERRNKRNIIIFLFSLLLVGALIYAVRVFDPVNIVDAIGIKNSYLILFFLGVLGGSSSFTSSIFLSIVITLSLGGLNPIIIGFVGGAGLVVSDSFFYFIGLKGRKVITPSWEKRVVKLSLWIDKRPRWFVPIILFIWIGLTPLPNDLLTAALGLIQYPMKKMITPIILGDIIFTMIVSYSVIYGIGLF